VDRISPAAVFIVSVSVLALFVDSRAQGRRTQVADADGAQSPAAAPTGRSLLQELEQYRKDRLAIEKLADASPDRFVTDLRGRLSKLESLVPQHASAEPVAYDEGLLRGELASGYLRLANFVRFTQKKPEEAIALYEKSASYAPTDATALAVAETYANDLNRKDEATRHYQTLLARHEQTALRAMCGSRLGRCMNLSAALSCERE
jgi:tetratricopeptide (TPR) repeat protein